MLQQTPTISVLGWIRGGRRRCFQWRDYLLYVLYSNSRDESTFERGLNLPKCVHGGFKPARWMVSKTGLDCQRYGAPGLAFADEGKTVYGSQQPAG